MFRGSLPVECLGKVRGLILVGGHDLVTAQSHEAPENDHVRGLLEELHAAVAQQDVRPARVIAEDLVIISGIVARGGAGRVQAVPQLAGWNLLLTWPETPKAASASAHLQNRRGSALSAGFQTL